MFFSPLIEQAVELAAQWHDATYRKGSWREPPFTPPDGALVHIPTVAHVTAVAFAVQRAGWEDEVVAAALLHDVLEDANRYNQRFREQQMRDLVGDRVTDLVRTLSEQKFDADGRRQRWRARKDGYLEQLRSGEPETMAISLADKLHNLWSMNESLSRDIGIFEDGPGRRALSAGPEAQQWFYRSVLAIATSYDDARLVPMKDRLDNELERFEGLVGLKVTAGHGT